MSLGQALFRFRHAVQADLFPGLRRNSGRWARGIGVSTACLSNAAIAIVRCDGRFRYIPEANRHYAARAQEALDAIMIAPIG